MEPLPASNASGNVPTKRTAAGSRRLAGVLLGVAVVVIVPAVPAIWWIKVQIQHANGDFGPSDYLRIKNMFGTGTAHMPATIPPNAKDVRVFCPGIEWSVMPSPDNHMELHMVVLPAEAAAIAASAKAQYGAIQSKINFGWDSLARNLHTVSTSSVSGAFEYYLVSLTRPSNKEYISGVTVNPLTGEVIYWFYSM